MASVDLQSIYIFQASMYYFGMSDSLEGRVAEDILVRFLSAGLINVGGDDAKLAKLKETASDLAAVLKGAPSKAAAFALIAFDPGAPEDDPVINEAVEALKNRWVSYVNTFSGTPIAVLRAILIDALSQAVDEDERVGIVVVATARNILPFVEVGNERAIWSDFVADIERRVDARAESEWATPESISIPAITFAAPPSIKISSELPSIDRAAFSKGLEAAAGPHGAGGATGGNPFWPNQNQNWTTEFSTRAADAIAKRIETVAKQMQIKPIDFSGPLTDLAQAVSANLEATLKAVSGATAGLQRRTNLIWWKESLYSQSARMSYREMPASTAAALMAFDLYQQVPTFSPAGVAAFLSEAVLCLPVPDPKEGRPIRVRLTELREAPQLQPLRDAAAQLFPHSGGRGPLLALATDPSPLDDSQFRGRVGVLAQTEISAPQWAMWLFREMQAARAAREGAEPKKRGRNAP